MMKRFIALFIVLLNVLCITAAAQTPIVLMYHRLSDKVASDAYTITPETFENDVKYLISKGYTFCTASEFDVAVKSKNTKGLVAITFDDGYESDYVYALPVLEKYNVSATFFVIGSKTDTPEYMTKAQLTALSNSKNVEIGNHFYKLHDTNYNILKTMYKKNVFSIKTDYDKNQKFLKEVLGKEVKATSYPYGLYGRYFDSILKKSGIITFCSEEQAFYNTMVPYGRYTRTADTTIENIIERAGNK